ncbi:hypothetical protein BOX15_Mlig018410g1 [Macrostomum lignano]|uniref:Troponin T n=1 Tax=Macrostomum lignano TaxID=282301 RepID=A0A267G895_9PLAT|nr:hypothetical protein BOX15_Mlig018410g1 [Macrostomum lignano]
MADEENQEPTVEEEAAAPPAQQEEEAEAAPPPPPPPPAEKPKQLHQGASFAEDESGRNEAQIRMEEEKKKRMAKMEEEMKEYEEMRKEEREKLAQEISELRSKREQRKQERAEEEKRLAELRAVEEQKRRAEEEERQRRKREEEAKRKEEREKKKKEAEERMKSQSQRNFTISKKSGGEAGASGADEAKQGKSKEQLEAEKKAALEQRVQPLNIDGFSESQLQEKAKELFSKIYSLEGDKYDLEQRFKGQNMEMVELTERARQMQKGGQKGSSSKVQTAPDPLSEKLGSIPPKIVMYSQYERVKDHRGFGERQELFKGPIYGIEYERIKPSSKIVLTESGPRAVELTENGDEPAPAAVEAAE